MVWGASTQIADYIFPHFVGIFMTSAVLLIIYALRMRNEPIVYPEIVFPGFLSGTVWSVAQICWFIANAKLGVSKILILLFFHCFFTPAYVVQLVITYPITTVCPALVAVIWGLIFREFSGVRNYIILVVAFSISIGSAVMIALSN